jgi:trk system potassium uptake protein TrkA
VFSQPKPKEFVVIGLGRFGASVALGLMHDKHTVLGIDRNVTIAQEFSH